MRHGRGCAQNYEQARRLYLLAAEQGIASAQFALGDIYYQGLGTAVEPEKAAEWYQKAADNGHVLALVALGSMHLSGKGRPVDEAEAAQLFLKAAEQGDPSAMYQVGVLHQEGRGGLVQNLDKAETYFRRAAKRSHRHACIALAELYTRGKGIEPDLREAAEWYTRAAELGCAVAIHCRAFVRARGWRTGELGDCGALVSARGRAGSRDSSA